MRPPRQCRQSSLTPGRRRLLRRGALRGVRASGPVTCDGFACVVESVEDPLSENECNGHDRSGNGSDQQAVLHGGGAFVLAAPGQYCLEVFDHYWETSPNSLVRGPSVARGVRKRGFRTGRLSQHRVWGQILRPPAVIGGSTFWWMGSHPLPPRSPIQVLRRTAAQASTPSSAPGHGSGRRASRTASSHGSSPSTS